MTQPHKQTNIILLIKLAVLSFIFCLPIAPSSYAEEHFVGQNTQSKINPFLLPSNIHFEHKVLKKIPLVERVLPEATLYLTFNTVTLLNVTPKYTQSKSSHFVESVYARGPPLYS